MNESIDSKLSMRIMKAADDTMTVALEWKRRAIESEARVVDLEAAILKAGKTVELRKAEMNKWELRMRERIIKIAEQIGFRSLDVGVECDSDAAVDWMEDEGISGLTKQRNSAWDRARELEGERDAALARVAAQGGEEE